MECHIILDTVNWDSNTGKTQYNFKALYVPEVANNYPDLTALVDLGSTTAEAMASIQDVVIAYASNTLSETITASDVYIDGIQYV